MTLADPVNDVEWSRTWELIRRVAQEQDSEHFASSFREWGRALDRFREVELERIYFGEPGQRDFRLHRICLYTLLAMGETLRLWSQNFNAAEWRAANTTCEDLEGFVELLHMSLREWHHHIDEADLEQIRQKVFGASA